MNHENGPRENHSLSTRHFIIRFRIEGDNILPSILRLLSLPSICTDNYFPNIKSHKINRGNKLSMKVDPITIEGEGAIVMVYG